MASTYDDIVRFMKEYFPAYSEKGQIPETHRIMDNFYAEDVEFDDGMVKGRDTWYQACLRHPAIQDKLTLEHLFVDERQKEAGALLTTRATDRKTGEVLLELKLNTLYCLNIDKNNDIKIKKVKVFLETNPEKVMKLSQLYNIQGPRPRK